MKTTELPLFPLNTVVFPQGLLPLRIFETRYLDMVRECTRSETGFGVCLIIEGSETSAGEHARIGTLIHIIDWYTGEDGILCITGRGSRQFRVQSTRIRDNGLLMGVVEWQQPMPEMPLPLEFSVLSALVSRYLENAADLFPDFQPKQLSDAAFVGNRLAELLPLSLLEKQQLLEMQDPLQRLSIIQEALPRFQPD